MSKFLIRKTDLKKFPPVLSFRQITRGQLRLRVTAKYRKKELARKHRGQVDLLSLAGRPSIGFEYDSYLSMAAQAHGRESEKGTRGRNSANQFLLTETLQEKAKKRGRGCTVGCVGEWKESESQRV